MEDKVTDGGAAFPQARLTKGVIQVSPYDDGSGCIVEVDFEQTKDGPKIYLKQSSDSWIWLRTEDIMPLISALSRAHVELLSARGEPK